MDEVAGEIWSLITASDFQNRSSPNRRQSLRRLSPEMARYFIDKHRDTQLPSSARQMALEAAVACGGPDAAAFVEELMTSGADGGLVTMCLLNGNFIFRPREFPVSASLLGFARRELQSRDVMKRQQGVAIMGHVRPEVSVPLLTALVQSEENENLRMTIMTVLGRIGDVGNLTQFKGQRDSLIRNAEDKRLMQSTLDEAIDQLEERLLPK